MKAARIFLYGITLAAIVLLQAGPASAQRLDGAWFKLKVSAKGYSVGPGEVISRAGFKATAYLLLELDAGNGNYDCRLYCETAPGTWAAQVLDGFIDPEFCTEDYIFMPDSDVTVYAPDGSYVHMYFTALIRSKVDKLDELCGAAFSVLGAEVDDGETAEGDTIYGGAKVKGKVVDESKVPFVP